MFFPEDLLFKSGQLAHVWIAAMQLKKLTKQQVLQDKINEDIEVIMRPEVAAGGPLALRLNGQLLLGVVRIYNRKAFYLHEDCNEALWKIKMAFRPGNIDQPAQTHIANPTSLTLPDMITDLDLDILAAPPDLDFLLSQNMDNNLDFGNPTMPAWDNSQYLSGSIEQPRREHVEVEEADLDLDFGDDDVQPTTIFNEGTSIEMGRNAPLERRASEELGLYEKDLPEDDLNLDMGDDLTELPRAQDANLDDDNDVAMGGMPDMDISVNPSVAGDVPQLAREESPLSELGEEEETRLAQEVADLNETMFQSDQEQEQEESVHQARAKRRRVLAQDAETMLSTATLREQQQNRDKILKAPSFLPRDPLLMALMNMQRSGGFVSNILGDGRSQGWAPELRGILSLEVVSRPSQKRKRDSGVADLGTEDNEAAAGAEKTPQLEFELEDPSLADMGGIGGGDSMVGGGDDHTELLDDPIQPQSHHEEDFNSPAADNFDDTTVPLVYPGESGPVSLETKHAVHLLRERFGPEAEESETQRQQNSILFQDMLPETRTSRKDATKMFFEVLVLATKDAIKVEQSTNGLGGPIRIRAKRGLWGEWAETGASGEVASEEQTAAQGEADVPAEPMLQTPRDVSVSA